MDPDRPPPLRARVRWGNVGRAAALVAVAALVVVWPRLSPSPPALPPVAPVPVAPRPTVAAPAAPVPAAPPPPRRAHRPQAAPRDPASRSRARGRRPRHPAKAAPWTPAPRGRVPVQAPRPRPSRPSVPPPPPAAGPGAAPEFRNEFG